MLYIQVAFAMLLCRNDSKTKSNNRRKRGKIDTIGNHIHDFPLSYLGTGTLVKCDGVKP
jgi:hypothetical protein